MNFAVTALLLSLCLLLMLGLGGCTSYVSFHDERHRRVITDTTAMLERNSYDAGLYVARGRAYVCKGKRDPDRPDAIKAYEKALSDFNRAIEIDSENAGAYRGRGLARYHVNPYVVLPTGRKAIITPQTHKGYAEDTKKADMLNPGKLDEEINQGFGYISNVTNEFIYPVTGYCVAGTSNLILGSTTTTQAAEMLPPDDYTSSHGARALTGKVTKPRIGKVGKVIDNVRSFYSTAYDTLPSALDLIFDKNDKLVVIRNIDSMLSSSEEDTYESIYEINPERLKKIGRMRREKYRDFMRKHQFAEVYRDDREKTMRAEITPCVTVDISVPSDPNSDFFIFGTEYIYTCPTK